MVSSPANKKVEPTIFSAIQSELSELEEGLALFKRALAEAAELCEDGQIPSKELADQLMTLNVGLESLLLQINELCSDIGVFFEPTRDIAKIRSWVDETENSYIADGDIAKACSILEFVLGMRHKTDQTFHGLDAAAKLARSLMPYLESVPIDTEIRHLIDGSHILSKLMFLVEHSQDLDEAQIENYFSEVTEKFGVQLALAASRGSLISDRAITEPVTPNDAEFASKQPSDKIDPTRPNVATGPGKDPTALSTTIDRQNTPASPNAIGKPLKYQSTPSPIDDMFLRRTVPVEYKLAGHASAASSIGLQQIDPKELLAKKNYCPHCDHSRSDANRNPCEHTPQNAQVTPIAHIEHAPSTSQPQSEIAKQSEATEEVGEKSGKELSSQKAVESYSQDSRLTTPAPEEIAPDFAIAENGFDQTLPCDTGSLAAGLQHSPDLHNCSSLILSLLRDGFPSLAFQLATYYDTVHSLEWQFPIPRWLFRAVLLGPSVKGEQDVSELARISGTEIFLEGAMDDARKDGLLGQLTGLLKIAACLRPALLAPSTGASEVLKSARVEALPNLTNYVQKVTAFGEQRWALDPHAFVFLKSKADLDSQTRALQERVQQWLSKAPQAEMIYGGTKKVWLHWLKPQELISNALQPITKGDFLAAEGLKDIAAKLADPVQIEREVHKTERVTRTMARDQTTGKALQKLQGGIAQVLEFVEEWINLCSVRGTLTNEFTRGHAERIRADLSSLHEPVLQEIREAIQTSGDWQLQGPLKLVHAAVNQIKQLFATDTYTQVIEPSLHQAERQDLVLIPQIRLNQSWDISHPQTDVEILDSVLTFLATQQPEILTSFTERLKIGDHVGALHIINLLKASGQLEEAERLTVKNEQVLRESRNKLQKSIDTTRHAIEEAVGLGLLRENERASYIDQLASAERALEQILNFPDYQTTLIRIRDDLSNKSQSEIDAVKRRLVGISASDKDLESINEIIESGDVLTANEYIDVLVRENALPEPTHVKDPFADFFPDKANKLEKFLEDPNTRHRIVRMVRERQNFCDLDLQKPLGAQTQRAADMLEAWFKAKDNKNVDHVAVVQNILFHLGFRIKSVIKSRFVHNRMWLDVVTEPIRDRDLCPIAKYGSAAEGNYRVLCFWDRPSEEDLLHEIGETVQGAPIIVFLFGRLSGHRRRVIARLSRDKRRTFVLVDDILMVYLAAEVGVRLPALLKCALPFTFAEPYTTTAGLVPPEIFYGRRQERDSIINQLGSCFIYGGRQLGKTALLRHVERDFNQPDKGQIAIWIDLIAEGIGNQRPIDDLAAVIANEFRRRNILKLPANVNLDKLLDSIRNWLSEEPTRRILLLLDEADKFLESDAQLSNGEGFTKTGKLKYLMDATQRRFKVVFAGLHNVQRMTRLANHPLAHYGEPICIGPLLHGADWRAARELIKAPLKAIGYDIPDDLIIRIMSQTNYYPSLIQLYCQELLRHVVQKQNLAKFESNEIPPFKLSDDFVRDAYLSQNLRKAIRERFIWTLQLDRRYEVIAYSIANATLGSNWEKAEKGFSVGWVQEQVMTWWSEGFKGKSHDEIKALLEEMAGLGILRDADNGKFALRSPNVVLLMGTEEEIVEALIAQREPPIEYEPNTFRAALPKSATKTDANRRSPLTALQQAELVNTERQISIIFGTEAAGLDDLPSFVKREFAFFHELSASIDKGQFARQLEERIVQGKNGATILLVSQVVPWTIEWLSDAAEYLRQLRKKGTIAKVVFLADPSISWQIAKDGVLAQLRDQWHTTTLRPWDDPALRQWLEDCQYIDADRSQRQIITKVTGNWPKLLYELNANRTRNTRWQTKLDDFKLDITNNRERYLAWFGLSDPKSIRNRVLTNLAIVSEASLSELTDLDHDISSNDVRQTVQWADALGLCLSGSMGHWTLDPLVQELLGSP